MKAAVFGYKFDKPLLFDLKTELKKLMFTPDGRVRPIPVCEDQTMFKMIMAAFSQYEKGVSDLKEHNLIS